MGIVSALGEGKELNRIALMQGNTGIGKTSYLQTRYADLPLGEVKLSTEEILCRLNRKEPGMTRTALLAFLALNESIRDSSLSEQGLGSEQTALIGANTVGGICLTDELYRDSNSSEKGSPYLFSYDCGSVSLFLQSYFKIGGIVSSINTACSSSANAIMYGARLISSGLAGRAIVGGCDSLAKFTINGFNALHILSDEPCRPFDQQRKGLNLGEGAAFLVLEKEELCRGKKIYARVSGYGNSNDAFHASSLSENGEGPFLAMKQALFKAGLEPGEINFINAHGTGTENNDEVESRAMIRLFGTVPPFASTKASTGHTLGAAGAIEAVFSIQNIYHGEFYPGLRFGEPISGIGLIPLTEYLKLETNPNHIMSNSFGFGGNCTSLIFSKV
jgi:3-oxoacyl-(acyl-carrier-protein) synthase